MITDSTCKCYFSRYVTNCSRKIIQDTGTLGFLPKFRLDPLAECYI